jgi:SbsC C-terminal domain
LKKWFSGILIAVLAISVVFGGSNSASAYSTADVEVIVKKAEVQADYLRRTISVEYTKEIKPFDLYRYNLTKSAYDKALAAVNSLKAGPNKRAFFSRLSANVKIQLDRAIFYSKAYNAGIKAEQQRVDLEKKIDAEIYFDYEVIDSYILLNTKLKDFHKRVGYVYGKTTRDAFVKKFTVPAETTKKRTDSLVLTGISLYEALYELDQEEVDLNYVLYHMDNAGRSIAGVEEEHKDTFNNYYYYYYDIEDMFIELTEEDWEGYEVISSGYVMGEDGKNDYTQLQIVFDVQGEQQVEVYDLEEAMIGPGFYLKTVEFNGYEYLLSFAKRDKDPHTYPGFTILYMGYAETTEEVVGQSLEGLEDIQQ